MLGLVAAIAPARAQQSSEPAFATRACDVPGVDVALAPRLTCGTVRVPRDHAHPEAGSFDLAVVVVKSGAASAQPDPVLYISGGPGAPLTIYAAAQARTPYAPARDLILVDQRGTGRSEPAVCPDHEQVLLDANVAMLTAGGPDAQTGRHDAYMACKREAEARGIDLADFGTRVTAEDLELVRRALNVARWNVYGESYGTTVAMTLATLHPETLRSLVLDSIYPPDPVPLSSEIIADARNAFFATCARDPACGEPDLAQTYRETLDRLAVPLALPAPVALRHLGDPLAFRAAAFEVMVAQLLYYPPRYPALPRIVRSVHDGHVEALTPLVAALTADASTQSRGLHAAVECRDRRHFHEPLPTPASILDRIQLYGICQDWAALGPPPVVPTGLAVPTLVLAGEFDPVARPSAAREIAARIGPAVRVIEFPRLGHNVRHFSSCAVRVVAGFIADPGRPPDLACVDQAPPIHFAPPG
jgi:pimeloyl-ACP methyl ester carboxylesterase